MNAKALYTVTKNMGAPQQAKKLQEIIESDKVFNKEEVLLEIENATVPMIRDVFARKVGKDAYKDWLEMFLSMLRSYHVDKMLWEATKKEPIAKAPFVEGYKTALNLFSVTHPKSFELMLIVCDDDSEIIYEVLGALDKYEKRDRSKDDTLFGRD